MKTPKPLAKACRTLSLILAAASALPPAVRAGDPIPIPSRQYSAYECVKTQYTIGGNTYSNYVKKDPAGMPDRHYEELHQEGNPQKLLYGDENCTKPTSNHLFKKDGKKYLHFHDPVEGVKKGAQIPLTAVSWREEPEGKVFPEDAPREQPKPQPAPVPGTGPGSPVDGEIGAPVTPPPGSDSGREANDPVSVILRLILESDKYDENIAGRLGAFLWNEKHSFVDEAYREKQPEIDPKISGQIRGWVKKELKTAREQYAGKKEGSTLARNLAALYVILGPGDSAPEGLPDFMGGLPEYEERVSACLKEFKTEKGAAATAPDEDLAKITVCTTDKPGKNPLKAGGAETYSQGWIIAFFTRAGEAAWGLFDRDRISLDDLRKMRDRKNRERQQNGPPTGNRPPGEGGFTTPTFDVDYLFGKWGDANVFHLNGRKLAIVPRMQRKFVRGSDGKMRQEFVQEFALYDISSPAHVYGRIFNMGVYTENFTLTSGGKGYSLTVAPMDGKNDFEIKIKGDGDTQPVFGRKGAKMPTMNELFQMRAEKARTSGLVTSFGGKEYVVTAESSDQAYFMYWSKETLDQIVAGKMSGRDVLPDAVAGVTRVANGRVVPVGDQVSTGLNIDGQWYDIRLNRDTGVWEPTKGEEPKETPKEKEKNGDGAGTSGGPVTTWSKIPLKDGGELLPDTPDAGAANAKLAEKGLHIYYMKDGAKFSYFLVNKDKNIAGLPLDPEKAASFEVVGGMLLATDKTGTLYVDAEKGLKDKAEGEGGKLYRLGKLIPKFNAFEGTGANAMLHALEKAGFSMDERGKVGERVAKALKDRPGKSYKIFSLNENGEKRAYVEFEGNVKLPVWPEFGVEQPATKDPRDVEVVGKGIILDKASLALNSYSKGDFQKKPDIKIPDSDDTAVEVAKIVEGQAVLYKAASAKKGKSEWHLRFTITHGDKVYASSLIKAFENPKGKAGDKLARTEFPDGVEIRGLDLAKVKERLKITDKWEPKDANTWQIRIVADATGTAKEKGALAVYDTGVEEGKYENFVGIVAYWGISAERADEIAQRKGA